MTTRRNRKLWLEPLEQRRVPAMFTVANAGDAVTGSLREAIDLAAASADPSNTVDVPAALGTITLSTELTYSAVNNLLIQSTGGETLTLTPVDSDGDVDNTDFLPFRARFNQPLP